MWVDRARIRCLLTICDEGHKAAVDFEQAIATQAKAFDHDGTKDPKENTTLKWTRSREIPCPFLLDLLRVLRAFMVKSSPRRIARSIRGVGARTGPFCGHGFGRRRFDLRQPILLP